ncbi:MAG: DUF6062 family protein [Veillonellales bacterium]
MLYDIGHYLEGQVCPVCAVVAENEARFVRWFDLEYASSPPMWAMMAGGGLCRKHSEQLEGLGTRLSAALRYVTDSRRSALAGLGQQVGETRKSWWMKGPDWFQRYFWRKSLKRQIAALTGTVGCPGCDSNRHAVRYGVIVMKEYLLREDGRELYRRYPTLCWTHLVDVLQQADTPETVNFLVDCHKVRMEQWAGEFEEYFRKLDYRYAQEPKGSEQQVWRIVLHFFARG